MKKCELCSKVARMYCDSDQASLCWDCDSRVHAANFLVAKHTRTLLCHSCQRLTPWSGFGSKLGPTVSVCEACVSGRDRDSRGPGNGSAREDDDGENQVVPMPLPPSLDSSSTSATSSSDASSSSKSSFSYHVAERVKESGAKKKTPWKWR